MILTLLSVSILAQIFILIPAAHCFSSRIGYDLNSVPNNDLDPISIPIGRTRNSLLDSIPLSLLRTLTEYVLIEKEKDLDAMPSTSTVQSDLAVAATGHEILFCHVPTPRNLCRFQVHTAAAGVVALLLHSVRGFKIPNRFPFSISHIKTRFGTKNCKWTDRGLEHLKMSGVAERRAASTLPPLAHDGQCRNGRSCPERSLEDSPFRVARAQLHLCRVRHRWTALLAVAERLDSRAADCEPEKNHCESESRTVLFLLRFYPKLRSVLSDGADAGGGGGGAGDARADAPHRSGV
ncbi:hypothetical protein EVAR_87469_1 [Eumeta japonica]|uniref:Uncharacterized protein n=1 Tax=Eumeta variegata TaxID=151549 RepID=A0A4C1VZ07_EUMVA|nr:hypothetical protein EVAR_87469_1 [Eumeta japonica]